MHTLNAGFVGTVLCAALTSSAAADELGAIGNIAISSSGNNYEITATVEGRSDSPFEVNASLAVVKSDASGSVQTRQSRTIVSEGQGSSQVAVTSVSLRRNGSLEVTLTIEESGVVIDRVTHTVLRNSLE